MICPPTMMQLMPMNQKFLWMFSKMLNLLSRRRSLDSLKDSVPMAHYHVSWNATDPWENAKFHQLGSSSSEGSNAFTATESYITISNRSMFLSVANMNVKIGDFGMASKLLEGGRCTDPYGTWRYMAPEVHCLGSRGYGMPVDVWSAGVIMCVTALSSLGLN